MKTARQRLGRTRRWVIKLGSARLSAALAPCPPRYLISAHSGAGCQALVSAIARQLAALEAGGSTLAGAGT